MINCSHGTKSLRSQTKRLFALSSGVQLLILLQAHLISNLIIVFSHRASVCPNCLSNGALAGNFRMLPHIGGDGFLLLADPVWDSLQVSALLDGFDFRLHLLDQPRQECLTFLPRLSIHIAGVLLAIRPDRRVAPLPAVFTDLGDTAGAGLSDLAVVGNEGDE